MVDGLDGKIEVIYPPGSDGSSANDSIASQTIDTIQKHKSTIRRFEEVAEQLHREHGHAALAAMLSMVHGAHHTPRSILSSRSGYTAINMNIPGFVSRRFVNDKLTRMLGTTIEMGEWQAYPGGAVVDISLESADRLHELLNSDKGKRFAAEVEIPSQLPDALLAMLPQGEYDSDRGRRGGSSSRYGSGSRGGGGARSGGSYGDRRGGGGFGGGFRSGDRNRGDRGDRGDRYRDDRRNKY
jgi:hypothetical protein